MLYFIDVYMKVNTFTCRHLKNVFPTTIVTGYVVHSGLLYSPSCPTLPHPTPPYPTLPYPTLFIFTQLCSLPFYSYNQLYYSYQSALIH